MPAFFGRRLGDRVVIEGDDAHHLARSLRARPGQEIEVVDPEGLMLKVRLDVVTPIRVEGAITAERPHRPEPAARVTIAIAHLPAPALELALSRCTEAGAHGFVVFPADRSVGRGEKIGRWSTICREAAMLAGRTHVPEVAAATSLTAVISAFHPAVMLVPAASRRLADLKVPRDLTLLIGPEGGWTDRELQLAAETATLGSRTLRAETAALVALAVALAARGD